MTHYIVTLQCPDQPGIVAALGQGVVNARGNILDNQQFSDPATGTLCMRAEIDSSLDVAEEIRNELVGTLAGFDPVISVRRVQDRRRMLVMVSKFDHCLVDLLYRHGTGELPVDIPLIVSNHETLAPVAEHAGIPFVHLPVTAETKAEAEAELLRLIEEHAVDFVVLARYMQVLSDELCRALRGRVINIHHSFLPGFKGAKPYHQAHERGVKLVGATGHYVTADLDEGPIIEQEVQRITHAFTAEQLVALGRDVERVVLSRAVRHHAEDRVFMVGARTVVFG